jgi:hypothetical protein
MTAREKAATIRAALAARAERERALPAALCRSCGGRVAAGEGERLETPAFADAHSRGEYDFWLKRLPADVDGWRRLCRICALSRSRRSTASDALAVLTGIRTTERVASEVLSTLVDYDHASEEFVGGFDAEGAKIATGKRWGHVSAEDRARLSAAYAEIAARSLPGTCAWGACGLCGRSEAVGAWVEGPKTLTWPDGSRAPVCPVCVPTWSKRGEPSDITELRRVGVECATGWPVALGVNVPRTFRLFAESAQANRSGLAEPWSWSDGLRGYIESVWTFHPEHAPSGRRAEFEDRRAAERNARELEFRQRRDREEAAAW